MNIKSLDKLPKINGVYDLYITYKTANKSIGIYTYLLTDRHNMRIDLLCYDIYGNTENIDILCNINGILNPLTIQQNTLMYFIDEQDLDSIRNDDNIKNAIINLISNANSGKEYSIDKNRIKDKLAIKNTENDKQYIPPNIIQTVDNKIEYSDGYIILKPNF